MSPGMQSSLPRAAKVIERVSEHESLEAMAERTQPLLDSGRFAPKNEEDLERLARRYYFSMRLPASYYPAKHEDRWTDWAIEQGIARAYIAMLEGDAIGVGPVMAIKNIHMINGIPTMSADLMFGRMLATRVLRRDDFTLVADKTKCVLTIGVLTRKIENRLVIEAKLEDFKHLHGKDNWKHHPEDMLVARAKSRACKRHAPDLFVGLYSREEIQDLQDDLRAGVPVEVPAEFMPRGESHTEPPPVAPVSVAETVQGAPAVADVEQTKRELNALGKRISEASDSISIEEIEKLRAEVERFNGVAPVGYGVLIAKWNAVGFLGPYVVTL
jgi:hypothetical protein